MSDNSVQRGLHATLLSDAHLGTGAGAAGIDAIVSRDRAGRPVIWASHLEGVLRDAARRLKGDAEAKRFFGYKGGEQQQAMFTSLYSDSHAEKPAHIWTSTARTSFRNRAPRDGTLRVIEYVPSGTTFTGMVELPANQVPFLERLLQEVDRLGSGRAAGSGRVKIQLLGPVAVLGGDDEGAQEEQPTASTDKSRLQLLLRNRDPLCITATATPDNLIPTHSFIPGRTLLGSIAAWLISERKRDAATLLTDGAISVTDALPITWRSGDRLPAEAIPVPLALQSEKPTPQDSTDLPWWYQDVPQVNRQNALAESTDAGQARLKRPEPDLYLYRKNGINRWKSLRPGKRVRLRNGRPDPDQPDPSLFAIEQIAEDTHFIATLAGSPEQLARLLDILSPILTGKRWLRVGRGGAPVEVVGHSWKQTATAAPADGSGYLLLTSDLMARDEMLRWLAELDTAELEKLTGIADLTVTRSLQESVKIRGFNGTSRLWRMPAVAIRRGSVYRLEGKGVKLLAERANRGEWLGERTHEGFGRFMVCAELPGITTLSKSKAVGKTERPDPTDTDEEDAAQQAKKRWDTVKKLLKNDSPSLSQWFDLVNDLEGRVSDALTSRLNPTKAGKQRWKNDGAQDVLNWLKALPADQHARYAQYFVRWLRAAERSKRRSER